MTSARLDVVSVVSRERRDVAVATYADVANIINIEMRRRGDRQVSEEIKRPERNSLVAPA